MNKKLLAQPIAAVIGVTVLASLAGVSFAAAEQNPFGMAGLSAGYTVAAGESSATGGAAATSQTPAPTVKKKRHKKSATNAAKKPMESTDDASKAKTGQ